ncbi:MAG: hypothetical protein EU530_06825 [Promethearchaeota archaeon]|nr:MAG: hypothetical protein EU530_06825 [Candidatus Lokiarchaeota archaeon]
MSLMQIQSILQDSPKFGEFVKRNPEYDTIFRILSVSDMNRIQKEFPELNLFPETFEGVIVVTYISRVLMQNGYPKLKAYINIKKSEILHIFVS